MCHLIFVCKYRKKLLSVFGTQVKKLLCDIAEENDIEIMNYQLVVMH